MGMSTVSIVIPNHNGCQLLSENLPAVVAHVPAGWDVEVTVVDDASTDGSVKFVQETFPQVRVLALAQNRGFGHACNAGVAACQTDVVVLLNTDMRPEPGYLLPLIEPLADNNVFAVMAQQIVPQETGTVYRGRTVGDFARGFFRHEFMLSDHPFEAPVPQPSLYAPGGGSAFSRAKYQALYGFDELFAPFYWEDVDLSLRAWRRGWRVLFEPRSMVVHPWSRTIYNENSLWRIRSVSARNAWLMVWKNALDNSNIVGNLAAIIPYLALNAARGNFYALAGFWNALELWPMARERRSIEMQNRLVGDRTLLERASRVLPMS